MSLESVYDVPVYSAPAEFIDLWSELDSAAWNAAAQQDQCQSQAPQWPPNQLPQPAPQQAFSWTNLTTIEGCAPMPLPENNRLPWAFNNGAVMPAVSALGDWTQNTTPVQQTKSPTLPVNLNNAAGVPVHQNNLTTLPVQPSAASSLPVHHNSPAWAMGPTPAWYPQAPITGKTLAQCISSNQIKPSQIFQTNATHNKDAHEPRFHITITPNRVIRKVPKRKRVRTAFTTDQILALEKVYSTQTYVNKDERQALTEKLNISDRAIKVWFQNRRMKGKRESQNTYDCSDEYEPECTEQEMHESCTEPSTSSDSYGSPSSELDYIESQIQRTDEQGFVTLDDKALGSLLNVINAFVPTNVDLVRKEPVLRKDMIYEPISPAETPSSAAEEAEQ